MALHGNYSVYQKIPATFRAGNSVSEVRSNFGDSGPLRNRFTGGMSSKTAIPNGHLAPSAWSLPQIGGGLATYTYLTSSISTAGQLNGGKGISASLSAAIVLSNADLGLIVSLLSSISGSGILTNAQLAATAGLAAAITASGSITDAQLGAIISMLSSISATGTATFNDFATADISANISSVTELSPQSLADAVWNAQLSNYPDTGSAGKALTDAQGAGNPWSALLVDNGDPGTFGERVQKLITLAQYLGLK